MPVSRQNDDTEGPAPGTKSETVDRAFVVALAKGLRVLEAFTVERRWLSNANIAERARLPKPTVTRFTKALVAGGYLSFDSGRRQYCLGTGVLALGYAGRVGNNVSEGVRPYLQRLADDFGVHAALVGRDKTNVIHLEVCRSADRLTTLQLDIGSRIPLAGTASGHALLSRIPEQERDYLLSYLAARHEKHWEQLEAEIRAGLKQVETVGYASSVHGWQAGITGVAAPGGAREAAPALAISGGGPSHYLPADRMPMIGERLVADAARIVAELAQKRADRQRDES